MLHYLLRNRKRNHVEKGVEARQQRTANAVIATGIVSLFVLVPLLLINLISKYNPLNFAHHGMNKVRLSASSRPASNYLTVLDNGQTIKTPTFKDSLPFSFHGKWQGQTEVIKSSMPSVEPGKTVPTRVVFQYTRDGLTGVNLLQPGWELVRYNVIWLGQSKAVITKLAQFHSTANDGTLTSVSKDKYFQLNSNQIMCKSTVECYENGSHTGDYQTQTILFRTM